MNCKKCGKELGPDDRFCSFCGSSVEVKEVLKQDLSETELLEGMGYGYKSGKTIQNDRFDEEWEREERKEKFTFMIFGVVIVVLVITIIVGMLTLLREESEKFMMSDAQISEDLKNDLQQNQNRDDAMTDNKLESGGVGNQSENSQDAAVTPELIQPNETEEKGEADKNNESSDERNELDEIKSEYIIYDSDRRYLIASDLNGLSAWEIRVARNEIFARYGRMFDSEDLREHFESTSWYIPLIPAAEFNASCLNSIESENLKFIVNYEKAHNLS